MPDHSGFSLASLGTANRNVPRFTISLTVTDSQTGAVIKDYTGANAITFPDDLGTILPNASEKMEFIRYISSYLIQKKLENVP